jgi:DNA replication and repair protein RecF
VRIERLYADGFRNLAAFELHPHPRFNVIEGGNGQGKTNVLEALYVAGGLRSFRTTRLAECISFDRDGATLAVRVERRGANSDLGVELVRKRTKAFVDGKSIGRGSDYLGRMTVVLFSTEDLRLPGGEPLARRRYLDRTIFNHHSGHLDSLRRYDKSLAQRNALLRGSQGRKVDLSLLEVLDEMVADSGAVLSHQRSEFVTNFGREVAVHFGELAQSGLTAGLRYRCKGELHVEMAIEQRRRALMEALFEGRERDLRRGFTGSGPHLDDLVLMIDDRPAKTHASQGQCRALILAMKIAEIRSLERQLAETPILLMDDVSSELDRNRNQALMSHLDALGGQVFLTTTDTRHVVLTAPRSVIHMLAGEAISQHEIDAGEPIQIDADETIESGVKQDAYPPRGG